MRIGQENESPFPLGRTLNLGGSSPFPVAVVSGVIRIRFFLFSSKGEV